MANKTLIEELYFCAAQCNHCYNACQIEKEKDQLQRCMSLDKDCEDICRLTAQLIERHSENTDLFLDLCSEVCKKCAAECEKHSHMEHCRMCAAACYKCADMCHNKELIH